MTLSGIGMCNKSSVTTLLWELQFIEFRENREISRFLRFFAIFENAHNVASGHNSKYIVIDETVQFHI